MSPYRNRRLIPGWDQQRAVELWLVRTATSYRRWALVFNLLYWTLLKVARYSVFEEQRVPMRVSVFDIWHVKNVLDAPTNVWKICRASAGIQAVDVWRSSDTSPPPAEPHVPSYGFAFRLACALLLIAIQVHAGEHSHSGLLTAAISASTNWEMRSGGNDTNGGGFNPAGAGTDWSKQNTPQYSVTDGVTAGSTTITSATAAFGTDVVGNIMYVQGGTGSVVAGWYQINTRTNATTIVVDRSAGLTAGTGVTLHIGGALASLGGLGAIPNLAGGHTCWIKSDGAYSITSATDNVSGGCFNSVTGSFHLEGYSTVRGDFGTRPVFTATGSISTFTAVTCTVIGNVVNNLDIDVSAYTSAKGIVVRGIVANCIVRQATAGAFLSNTATTLVNCYSPNSLTLAAFQGSAMNACIDCVAYNFNGGGPFGSLATGTVMARCVADAAGQATTGFSCSVAGQVCTNCVAYNNQNGAGAGFAGTQPVTFINCIAEAGGGYGFTGTSITTMLNCAAFGNSSGTFSLTGTHTVNIGFITGTASFFTSPGTGDFSLNNTAGGGALCRAAGYPGTLPYGGRSYLDVGALQHACTLLLGLIFKNRLWT